MKSSCIFITLLSLLLLAGCRSSKKTVSQPSSEALPVEAPLNKHFGRLADSYGEWLDVNVPVNVNVTAPQRLSVSGRVKMIRDESVDISMRMLGFEVARLYITTDSIFAKLRPNKVYLAEPLTILSSHVPFTIGNIQDMLVGRLFLLGADTMTPSMSGKFTLERGDNGSDEWLLLPKSQPAAASYGYAAGYDDLLRRIMILVSGSDVTCNIVYSGHDYVERVGSLATDVSIEVTGKNRVEAAFYWRWNDARWNEGVESAWSTPDGYKRMNVSKLFKSLAQ